MSHSTTETSNSVNKSIPKYNRPHLIVPSEDMDWVLDQKQAIQILWKEAWKCDPYGSRFVQFSTSLSKSAFAAARKVLKESLPKMSNTLSSLLEGSFRYVTPSLSNAHVERVEAGRPAWISIIR
jgi:hypothetical protein